MQNKSNIYTINNAAPPSYAEATGASASKTHNPQFDKRYPHIVVCSPSAPFPYPYSPNCYLDRTPVQSAYPQYESPEWQSQPTSTSYNRTLITRTKYEKHCRKLIAVLIVSICVITFMGIAYIGVYSRYT